MIPDKGKTFTKEELKDIHDKAVKRFQQSILDEQDWRLNYIDDMKFVDGDQWPPDVMAMRGDRPSLVINETRKYCENVGNNERMGTPSLKASPDGYGTATEAAESRSVIFSHIQNISDSKTVFDTAFDCQLKGARGAFRILSKYVDDELFDQDLILQRIPDPMTVVFDQTAKELTYSDARYCFIVQDIPEDDFKEQYPDAKPIDWEKTTVVGAKSTFFNFSEKKVKIAEYYFKEPVKRSIGKFSDESVWDMGTDYFKETAKPILDKMGVKLVKSKEINSHDVYWCKLNGVEIFEGPIKEPTPDIPVILVIGRETWLNGKRLLSSLVKDAKDPNRMLNYWVSSASEQVALQGSNEYILTPEAIANYEDEWDSETPVKYKRYNMGSEKPYREPPTQLSPSLAAMIEMSAAQIPSVLGISPDSLGQPTNARSQSAITERKQNSQAGPYVFIDHFLKAVVYAGQIINRRIQYYYDTNRVISIQNEDGTHTSTEINAYDPATGGIKNDMSKGRFKVVIEAGPSYATRRKEAGDSMMQALQWAGPFADVIIPQIAHVQSWPGARKIEQAIDQKIQAMKNPKPSVRSMKDNANLQGVQLNNARMTKDLQDRGINTDQPGQAENNPQGGP